MQCLCLSRTGFHPDIYIQTDDDELFNVLIKMYRSFILNNCESQSHPLMLSVNEKDNTTYFQCNNEIIQIPKESSLQLIENAIYENTSTNLEYLSLHAAVVARQDRAYIFLGQTKTGKTTLCTYLTAHGFEYLSDDVVLINKKTLKLIPFLNPIHLRPDSIDILKKYGVEINDLVEINYGDIHRFVYYPKDKTKFNEYIIDNLYFIERDTEINDIKQLPAYLSFQKILESQMNPSQHCLAFETIKSLTNNEIFKVRYSDMSYIERLIIPKI